MHYLQRIVSDEEAYVAGYRAPAPDAREIFVFPGYDGALAEPKYTERVHRVLSGIARILTDCLPPPRVQPCLVAYGRDLDMPNILDCIAHPEQARSPDADQFVQEMLLPRLFTEAAKPHPEILIQRMSRLTFVGHSYGAMFGQQVANGLAARLKKKGYRPEEVRRVIQAGVLITTAGSSALNSDAPQFTSLHFRGSNDVFLREGLQFMVAMLYPNATEEERAKILTRTEHRLGLDGQPHFTMRYGDDYTLLCSDLPEAIDEKHVHDQVTAKRDNHRMDVRHTPPAYWYEGERDGEMLNREMVGHARRALCNAVGRAAKRPRMLDLLTGPGGMCESERARGAKVMRAVIARGG